MALTSKEIADCIEFINYELDRIPFKNIEEFSMFQKGLQSIIGGTEIDISDLDFKKHIESIKDDYDAPEDYVAKPEDYPEFQQLFRDRMSKKITTIANVTEQQKQVIIVKKVWPDTDKPQQSVPTSPPTLRREHHPAVSPEEKPSKKRAGLWGKITNWFKKQWTKIKKFFNNLIPSVSMKTPSHPKSGSSSIPKTKSHKKQKKIATEATAVMKKRGPEIRTANIDPKSSKTKDTFVTEQMWHKKKSGTIEPKTTSKDEGSEERPHPKK